MGHCGGVPCRSSSLWAARRAAGADERRDPKPLALGRAASIFPANLPQGRSLADRGRSGGMAEWLKAHAWKACIRATVSWVRIPLPPPRCMIRHRLSACIGAFADAAAATCLSITGRQEPDRRRLVCLTSRRTYLYGHGQHARRAAWPALGGGIQACKARSQVKAREGSCATCAPTCPDHGNFGQDSRAQLSLPTTLASSISGCGVARGVNDGAGQTGTSPTETPRSMRP